jgi:hypothetical protein
VAATGAQTANTAAKTAARPPDSRQFMRRGSLHDGNEVDDDAVWRTLSSLSGRLP